LPSAALDEPDSAKKKVAAKPALPGVLFQALAKQK